MAVKIFMKNIHVLFSLLVFVSYSNSATAGSAEVLDFTDRIVIKKGEYDSYAFSFCHLKKCKKIGHSGNYTKAQLKAAHDIVSPIGKGGLMSAEMLYAVERDPMATFFVMGRVGERAMGVTNNQHDLNLLDFFEKADNSNSPTAYVRKNVPDVLASFPKDRYNQVAEYYLEFDKAMKQVERPQK